MDALLSIFKQFFPGVQSVNIQPLGDGLINTTYRSDTESGSYVLQKINTRIFPDTDGLMQNTVRVTDWMREKLKREGIDPERRVPTFYQTTGGAWTYRDEANGVWRCSRLIGNAHAHTTIADASLLYQAGRGYGEFQRLSDGFPSDSLCEVLPDFHNTRKRFADFQRAVEQNTADRKKEAEAEIRYLLSQEKLAGAVLDLLESGEIPTRVTHNDAKLSNVLLDDETGEAVCVIDLDTVMNGTVLYDFGDAIRTGAASTREDDPITEHMRFLPAQYDAFKNGFLEKCGEILLPAEIDHLMLGARVIIYEQALRFLTDFLNGDVYYQTVFEAHNLVRARTQIRLLAKINDLI